MVADAVEQAWCNGRVQAPAGASPPAGTRWAPLLLPDLACLRMAHFQAPAGGPGLPASSAELSASLRSRITAMAAASAASRWRSYAAASNAPPLLPGAADAAQGSMRSRRRLRTAAAAAAGPARRAVAGSKCAAATAAENHWRASPPCSEASHHPHLATARVFVPSASL